MARVGFSLRTARRARRANDAAESRPAHTDCHRGDSVFRRPSPGLSHPDSQKDGAGSDEEPRPAEAQADAEVSVGGVGSEGKPRSARDQARRQDAGEDRRFGTSWARQLGSLIQSGRTPFAHFWRVYQQRKGIKSRPKGGLFPCALPDSLRDGSKRPRSARRAARWRRHKAAKDVTRLIFAASNFVALGRQRRCPRALPRAESAAHHTALTFVRLRALQFVRLMEAGGAIAGQERRACETLEIKELFP